LCALSASLRPSQAVLFLTQHDFYDKVPFMYVLGIETSTKTGSVAIVSEQGVVAQYSLNIEVTHSERLMSTVDRVLKDTGLTVVQIDGFSVAIGPGSFTGLRIGLSTVKGLALVTGRPTAAVPTLLALAWNLPFAACPVCPMLDARKSEVYAAIYSFDGAAYAQLMPETAISIRGLAEKISGEILFTGEAAHIYRQEIVKQFGDRARFAPLSAALPSAAIVAELGLDMLKHGKRTDADSLTPLYIRRPEAEVAWEKRRTSR
jgi:tRNA threonylcarbamoyladenosine biosynthesis protein TsaB